jgi:hypothetical protein
VDWQFINSGGTVHSFTNPDAASIGAPGIAYNKSADERSWRAMTSFFAEISLHEAARIGLSCWRTRRLASSDDVRLQLVSTSQVQAVTSARRLTRPGDDRENEHIGRTGLEVANSVGEIRHSPSSAPASITGSQDRELLLAHSPVSNSSDVENRDLGPMVLRSGQMSRLAR